MSNIVLCHEKKAETPFYVKRASLNIYTIEELCYYIYHNLYLIDSTLMNTQLCDWLEKELKLPELAGELRKEVEYRISVQAFVLPILTQISYCSEEELEEVKSQLQALKRQTATERRKFRADYLLKNGLVWQAVKEYQLILSDEQDEKLKAEFLALVYHNLGTAYARLFVYDEAAVYYGAAYEYNQSQETLKAYVNACFYSMDKEKFEEFVEEGAYYKIASESEQERASLRQKYKGTARTEKDKTLDQKTAGWKQSYEKCILV